MAQFAPAALQIVGSLFQGQSQARAYESRAGMYDYQAELDRQRAVVARQQGLSNELQQRRQANQQLAASTVSAVESGTSKGSGADVIAQSARNAELDALNIRYGAELQAQGAQAQSQMDAYAGRIERFNASAAKRAGWLNAGSAALSSYGSYLGNQAKIGRTS